MKVKFWIYMRNSGDGSVCNYHFRTEKAARNYASYDDERFCEDIKSVTLEFSAQGELITPEPQVDDWQIARGKVSEDH